MQFFERDYIEEPQDIVVVRCFNRLSGVEEEEFEVSIPNVLTFAAVALDRLGRTEATERLVEYAKSVFKTELQRLQTAGATLLSLYQENRLEY